MIRSMTAFASAEGPSELGLLSCELRTVNHRYLDVSLRLPEDLRALEPTLRERIGQHLARGKVDLGMRVRTDSHDAVVADEISFARRLFARKGWPVIDVTRRSIEETAAAVLNLYNERQRASIS